LTSARWPISASSARRTAAITGLRDPALFDAFALPASLC
jgi:hypothetical protein